MSVKKRFFLTVALCQFFFILSSQENKGDNYSLSEGNGKQYEARFNDTVIETPDYSIRFYNVVGDQKHYGVRVRIANKTSDFMKFDPSQVIFLIDGTEYKAEGRATYIEPKEENARQISVKIEKSIFPKFILKFSGLYLLEKKSIAVLPDYPAIGIHEPISVSNFTCEKTAGEIDEHLLRVKLKCEYKGSDIGIIQSRVTSVVFSNNDREFNVDKAPKPQYLQAGDKETIGMVFEDPTKKLKLKESDPKIRWRDCFFEVTPKPLDGFKLKFILNEQKTEDKNKSFFDQQ